jgi:hypothetical protein
MCIASRNSNAIMGRQQIRILQKNRRPQKKKGRDLEHIRDDIPITSR